MACKLCHKLFKGELSLKEHERNLHSEKKHLCTLCPKRYCTGALLHKHLIRTHGEAGIEVMQQIELEREQRPKKVKKELKGERNAEDSGKTVCEVCGFVAASASALWSHKNRKQ